MIRPLVFVLLCFACHLSQAEDWRLSAQCPPGFEQINSQCEFRSLYQLYDSLQGKGLGGTRTALPPIRDGFSPQQIDLGRFLFFDPLLSGDGTISCASCHDPALGFSDGRARSIGIAGRQVDRAAPTLWNVGFLQTLFWDARSHSLEDQAKGPLFAANEMGNTEAQLLADLNANAIYQRLFRQAYPDKNAIDLEQVVSALSAFQSSLISLNSKYDRYAHGDQDALNSEEIAGLNVFRSFVARCSECHTPPLFTNQQIAVIGSPEPEGLPFDIGAEKTIGAAKLRGGFKVPTLRNIAKSAPYMHSGKFNTLRETVAFYNGGRGHAAPPEQNLHLHWHIVSPDLQDHELDLLVSFLQTLNDETFMPATPSTLPSKIEITNKR